MTEVNVSKPALDQLNAELKAMGAPGDHGYGTPAGDSLMLAHRIMSACYALQFHVEYQTERLRIAILRAEEAEGAATAGQTPAAHDVLAERARQISAEGFLPSHDDAYQARDLANAAGCYALVAGLSPAHREIMAGKAPHPWPWARSWWKPTTPRRDLVKSGALILAEIERLDRAKADPQENANELL